MEVSKGISTRIFTPKRKKIVKRDNWMTQKVCDGSITYFFAKFLRTRCSEYVAVMATFWTSEGRHVVDKTQNRNPDFLEHQRTFPGINQGNFLRCCHNYCTSNRNILSNRELSVPCTRGLNQILLTVSSLKKKFVIQRAIYTISMMR